MATRRRPVARRIPDKDSSYTATHSALCNGRGLGGHIASIAFLDVCVMVLAEQLRRLFGEPSSKGRMRQSGGRWWGPADTLCRVVSISWLDRRSAGSWHGRLRATNFFMKHGQTPLCQARRDTETCVLPELLRQRELVARKEDDVQFSAGRGSLIVLWADGELNKPHWYGRSCLGGAIDHELATLFCDPPCGTE